MDYLLRGCKDTSDEARDGLAIGLRRTFFDGLQEITTDWFIDEENRDVRFHIIDHMATNAERERRYRDYVEQEYELASPESLERRRIEAMCEGTALYRDLKKSSLQSQMGQLGFPSVHIERQVNVSKDINIGGSVQAGTISTGDNAKSSHVTNYDSKKVIVIKQILDDATQLLNLEGIPASVRDAGLADIEKAKEEPSPSRLKKLADFLAGLESVGVASTKVLTAAGSIIAKILTVLGGSGAE